MIKDLPEKLKKLRHQYYLSQRDVAHKLSISPASIAAYETGERTPSVEIILALARLYHCSTDYLLGNNRESVPESAYMTIDLEGLTGRETKILLELIDAMRENR